MRTDRAADRAGGDQVPIGARGISLSGGQKARVAALIIAQHHDGFDPVEPGAPSLADSVFYRT